MSKRFLITGLPRSRTAWLAVASGALHEPISLHGPAWIADWQDGEGVSDSGAAPFLPFILKTVAPRTLIIERPRAEVVASLVAYFGRPDLEGEIDALLDAPLRGLSVESPLIRRVDYHRLADLACVEDCLDWLGCERPKNLAQLSHMNIQVEPCYVKALLLERAA